MNKMHYNPHFDFEGKIQEHPYDSTVILDLFDAAAGNEIYDQAKRDSRYFPAAQIHYLDASKHLPFPAYIYKTSVICYKVSSKAKQPCTTTYSRYHPDLNKVNNHYIIGFAPPPPGVPCIVLFKNHFQYIMTTKIKIQVLQNSLGRRGDPLPLKQNVKDRRAIIEERLAQLKRNEIVKPIVPQNESPEGRISPADDSKNNKDLLSSVKSRTEELASRTFDDSNPISQKDSFNGNSFVERNQKDNSPDFIQSGIIPVQTETASSDKSEKGNNSEAFCASSFNSSEIANARDSIVVIKIDNENDTREWIRENIGIIEEVTGDGNCGYRSFIGACNHTRKTFDVDLPKMRSTKQFLLDMRKDLKQGCHNNYHLFIEGNRKQDKPSIGCGEDVNNMFYNPLFEFGTILEDLSSTFSIIELFDNAIGKEIYNEEFDTLIGFLLKIQITI